MKIIIKKKSNGIHPILITEAHEVEQDAEDFKVLVKVNKIISKYNKKQAKMPKIIQIISLKDCLRPGDEDKSYYSLYGDLYFEVPHYVISYKVEYGNISVKYPGGHTLGISTMEYVNSLKRRLK